MTEVAIPWWNVNLKKLTIGLQLHMPWWVFWLHNQWGNNDSNMAELDGHVEDPLLNNFILQDIEGTIAHILGGLSCKPKSDIVERLVQEIELDVLVECREFLFKAATGLYDEQLETSGIKGGKARLELKQRRGDTVHQKCAEDTVELACYICGLTKFFPRSVVSSRSVYIDLEVKDAVDKEKSNGDATENRELTDKTNN